MGLHLGLAALDVIQFSGCFAIGRVCFSPFFPPGEFPVYMSESSEEQNGKEETPAVPRYCRAVQLPGAPAKYPAPEDAFVGDRGPWQSWGCGTTLSCDLQIHILARFSSPDAFRSHWFAVYIKIVPL